MDRTKVVLDQLYTVTAKLCMMPSETLLASRKSFGFALITCFKNALFL